MSMTLTVREARIRIFHELVAGGVTGLTFDELAAHSAFRNWTEMALATALGDSLSRGLVMVDDSGRVRAPGQIRNEIEGIIEPGAPALGRGDA